MKRFVHRVGPTDSLRTAAQVMREEEVGFLVVCDQAEAVIGVITDRDIVLRGCADDRTMSATRVELVMSPDVISARPSQDIREVETLMKEHRKSRIVVIEEDGTLCGVLSLSDVAQYESAEKTAETLVGVTARKYAHS